jgi:hypothetical protein
MSEARFVMPAVELGEAVWWYPDGNATLPPHAAFVSHVGLDSLCLNVLAPNSYNFLIRDGARHVSDPRAKAPELREQGAWDHTPRAKKLRALEAAVLKLQEALAQARGK